MANPASLVIAGEYTGTWNSNAIGLTEDGFNITWSFSKEEVMADSYGDTVLDAVYRGGNMFVEFTCKAYRAAAIAGMIWPYSATFGAVGIVGQMDVNSSLAKSLVLTDIAGTPATTFPADWTFHSTILDNEHEVAFALNNRHRVIPIRLRCYPTDVSASIRWFTTT